MNRSTLFSIVALSAALLATATLAHAAEAGPDITAEQVHAAFSRGGYVVDAPTAWADGVVSLAVHTPGGERPGWPGLRVLVFPDLAAAAAAHQQAAARDEALRDKPSAAGADRGPQLLAGYGATAWLRNVALIQLSGPDDPVAFPVEPDCSPTPVFTSSSTPELGARSSALPRTGVDTHFLQLLEPLGSRF
jgi:hypothetical protein